MGTRLVLPTIMKLGFSLGDGLHLFKTLLLSFLQLTFRQNLDCFREPLSVSQICLVECMHTGYCFGVAALNRLFALFMVF